MRKILWLPLLAAVCGFTSLLRADITIVQHVDGIGQDRDATIMVKAGRTRVDPSPAMSVITDLKSGERITLRHDLKICLRTPGPPHQAAIMDLELPNMPKEGGLSLTPIGKTETINGYAADAYACTPHLPADVSEKKWTAMAGMKTTMWLTQSVVDYANILKEMSALYVEGPAPRFPSLFGSDLATLPGFPVRTTYEFQPGQTVTSTVVSISSKPIADSEFDIPADYKQIPSPVVPPKPQAPRYLRRPSPFF